MSDAGAARQDGAQLERNAIGLTEAFDPETGMYYAVSLTLPGVRAVVATAGNSTATMDYAGPGPSGPTNEPGFVQGLGPQLHGLPIVKPPYGRITAFNLNTGDQAWMVANGPSGLTYHPGVSLLPEKYKDHFFLVDFRGGSVGYSLILSLHRILKAPEQCHPVLRIGS